jgi:flagellar biosynthesis protein FliR
MGLHLTCIGILADSFTLLPPGRVPGIFGGIDLLLEALAHTMVLGMQLAGPVLALVWMVQVFVMVLTKMAPRMNIYFSVGMMLVNGAGLMLLGLSFPYLLKTHGEAMHYATDLMTQAVQALL